MTAPNPNPLPDDVGADRPLPIVPAAAVLDVRKAAGILVDGRPVIRIGIIHGQGSAYAHMTIEQAEGWLAQAGDVVREAKTGIAVARPGGIVLPPGVNGHHT